ncbi:hypothetical protein [Streptococcus pseudopneumoniae]|uniref:hypothetical protein n=1 Tax=Streptococcus pseudopneumoniae TaxID=257758 RepID=UPI003D80E00B
MDEATKKAIEENVKEVNPGSTVVVDENGNATVTTPATGDKPGNTATIPAKDLVKNEADASQAGAGNNVNKPADKVLVDPAKGIDEALTAVLIPTTVLTLTTAVLPTLLLIIATV